MACWPVDVIKASCMCATPCTFTLFNENALDDLISMGIQVDYARSKVAVSQQDNKPALVMRTCHWTALEAAMWLADDKTYRRWGEPRRRIYGLTMSLSDSELCTPEDLPLLDAEQIKTITTLDRVKQSCCCTTPCQLMHTSWSLFRWFLRHDVPIYGCYAAFPERMTVTTCGMRAAYAACALTGLAVPGSEVEQWKFDAEAR